MIVRKTLVAGQPQVEQDVPSCAQANSPLQAPQAQTVALPPYALLHMVDLLGLFGNADLLPLPASFDAGLRQRFYSPS
jgi:hypothetical protein